MHDGSDMILTETPKEKLHLSFLDCLTFFVLLTGAVGGGFGIARALAHFGVSSGICSTAGGLYWILYSALVIFRIRTKSDVQCSKDAAYAEGFLDGKKRESAVSYAAGEKAGYDRGYQTGLLDGRAEGWDHGYACARRDMNGGAHD